MVPAYLIHASLNFAICKVLVLYGAPKAKVSPQKLFNPHTPVDRPRGQLLSIRFRTADIKVTAPTVSQCRAQIDSDHAARSFTCFKFGLRGPDILFGATAFSLWMKGIGRYTVLIRSGRQGLHVKGFLRFVRRMAALKKISFSRIKQVDKLDFDGVLYMKEIREKRAIATAYIERKDVIE